MRSKKRDRRALGRREKQGISGKAKEGERAAEREERGRMGILYTERRVREKMGRDGKEKYGVEVKKKKKKRYRKKEREKRDLKGVLKKRVQETWKSKTWKETKRRSGGEMR